MKQNDFLQFHLAQYQVEKKEKLVVNAAEQKKDCNSITESNPEESNTEISQCLICLVNYVLYTLKHVKQIVLVIAILSN